MPVFFRERSMAQTTAYAKFAQYITMSSNKEHPILSLAVRNTGKLIREKSKSENIRLGRLFTKKDTACLMADMLEISPEKTAYTLLDPGAGTGILSAAAVEAIAQRSSSVKQIFLTCYETDPAFLSQLYDNLERIRKICRHDYNIKLYTTVYEENYIVDSKKHYTVTYFDTAEEKYDIIICNPPTEYYAKDSEEARSAGGVTQVKIGAQFLFARMAQRHLEDGGQLVIMLPTTYATASQLTALRKEMASELAIHKIHLFIGKQKNAKRAIPLKKNIIISYVKGEKPEELSISTSQDNGKNVTALPKLPYGFVVDKDNGMLTLPKSVEDTNIVRHFQKFTETLSTLGLKMSTGLIIDSKCEGLLFTEPNKSTVPLIRPAAIKNGGIEFPQPIKRQYIAPVSPSLMQRNKNMLIIKRIPAKSDERFVNSAVYLASLLPSYQYISTHNKINFIDTKDKNSEIGPRLLFGLYALLNSTIYDRYISIISKSKQINSKEMKNLPLPPRNLIESLGLRIMSVRQTSVKACDQIVNPALHIIESK